MRYTLEREQNSYVAISVGVRPAVHRRRTWNASRYPWRARRNSASIHSCSDSEICSMVEPDTVIPPLYLGGVATPDISVRPSLCQSHASWFSFGQHFLDRLLSVTGAILMPIAASFLCFHCLDNTRLLFLPHGCLECLLSRANLARPLKGRLPCVDRILISASEQPLIFVRQQDISSGALTRSPHRPGLIALLLSLLWSGYWFTIQIISTHTLCSVAQH